MPVAGCTGDLDNECAADDMAFPEATLSETAEGFDEMSDHQFKVLGVNCGESEVLQVATRDKRYAIDEVFEAFPYAG
jgi:hypothetical protein